MSSTEPQPSSEGLDQWEREAATHPSAWYNARILALITALRQAQAQVEQLQLAEELARGEWLEWRTEADTLQDELAIVNERYAGLWKTCDELGKLVATVKTERDQWNSDHAYDVMVRLDRYEYFERLEARVRELEEAMRPLVDGVPKQIDGLNDDGVYLAHKVNDLRRARAVLEAKGESNAKSG